ncbi:zf-HC2 domain-containing protein [Myxococcaceae bacterium GXIMD 01537]
MLEPHLTRVDVEAYVLGALDSEAAAKLEAHTLTCDPCALLLQQEALLEEQLREVAATATRDPPAVIRPARWRRTVAAVVGPALAAAAAAGFLMLRTPAPPKPVTSGLAEAADTPLEISRVVACPDMLTQESCAATAAARGLMVQFPRGVGEVPRYEGHAGLPPGALSQRGPAPL